MSLLQPSAPEAASRTEAKPWYFRWWALSLAALCLLGTGAALGEDDTAATSGTAAAPTATATVTVTAPVVPVTAGVATATVTQTAKPIPAETVTVTSEAASDPEPDGFDDGTYLVGTDIKAGRYRAVGGESLCYWARLSGTGGELDDIISNGNRPTIVTIKSGDKAFETNGCGTWRKA